MNKKKLLAPLFIAASFMLVACSTSEIVARPTWIDDAIVSGDLKDNKLKEIYDAIKALGDTNTNILNKVMYDIAQKQLGHYEDVKNDDGTIIELGLKHFDEIIDPYNISDESLKLLVDKFIETYPIYKSEDKTYQLQNDEPTLVNITDANIKRAISIRKIKEQYQRVKEDIYHKLYDEIKNENYSTKVDKYFQEDYFLQYLYKEMYFDNYPTISKEGLVTKGVFIPKTKDQTWEDYITADSEGGFLHTSTHYEYYKEYIDRKLLPEIYRTLLIENYVREQRYTNLGRSYARKVNMITIPRDSDKTTGEKVAKLLTNFAKTNITDPTSIGSEYNLEYVKDAMVGFATTEAEKTTIETTEPEMRRTYKMLDNDGVGESGLHFEKLKVQTDKGEKDLIWRIRTDKLGVAIDDYDPPVPPTPVHYYSTYVYRGTKLYDLAQKYIKIMDVKYTPASDDAATDLWGDFDFSLKDHFTSDEQTIYDELTNNHAYPVEKGVILKERELRQTDMTTDGWFLKNGGLTDLNEKFRDKLFKINTSQIIDNEMEKDTPDSKDTVRYFGSKAKIGGRYSNRKAFVFENEGGTKTKEASIVFNDGSSSFHIVEVEEAASASKLSYSSLDDSYMALHATDNAKLGDSNVDMDAIVRKVTEQVANSDTYKKNAEQYYLMISNILFYDQSVYDYFKSQFPELFK